MCVTVTDWIRFSNNLRLRANKSAISVITYDYLLEMIMTCKTEADKYKRMADSSMKNHSLSVRDASKMIVKFRAEIRELQDTIDAQRLESMKFKEKAMKEKKAFEKALKRRRKVITNVIEDRKSVV